MIVCPTVTCPSPAMTTRPPWRTQTIVVPRISGTGMRLVVRLHEPPEVDVRVALGRRQARVPEQLLDGAQIRARAEEMGREGMTERVRGRLRGRSAHEHVTPELAGDA